MDVVGSVLLEALQRFTSPFLSFGSVFSIASLACALVVSIAVLALRRRRRGRRAPLKVILRALFPRQLIRHRSTRIDLSYLAFSIFIYGAIFGWAAISYQSVANGVMAALTLAFGAPSPTALPEIAVRAIVTLALFLAYELGYWLHHYLCHRVPVLWEFHRVHHTASVLTPLTVFRVHPVDTLLFVNILALVIGATSGVANHAFGVTAQQYAVTNTNVILVVFIYAYIHLQHSQLWIAFRGLAGRLLLSPAHHQIHHSSNPVHFNRNLGSCLAIWDWLFGTLHVPAKQREKLAFGAEQGVRDIHTLEEAYLTPFARAASHVAVRGERPVETAR